MKWQFCNGQNIKQCGLYSKISEIKIDIKSTKELKKMSNKLIILIFAVGIIVFLHLLSCTENKSNKTNKYETSKENKLWKHPFVNKEKERWEWPLELMKHSQEKGIDVLAFATGPKAEILQLVSKDFDEISSFEFLCQDGFLTQKLKLGYTRIEFYKGYVSRSTLVSVFPPD